MTREQPREEHEAAQLLIEEPLRTASSRGAAQVIEGADWKSTTALVKAVRESVLRDLGAATQLAEQSEKEMLP